MATNGEGKKSDEPPEPPDGYTDYMAVKRSNLLHESRLHSAAAFEISVVVLYIYLSLAKRYLNNPGTGSPWLLDAFLDTSILLPMALLFMQIVIFILTRRGLITGLIIERFLQKQTIKMLPGNGAPRESSTGSYDPVSTEFQRVLDRSKQAFNSAQNKPIALLFVGAAVAAGGLVFFIWTLPQLSISVSDKGFVGGVPPPTDFAMQIVELMPRLLMLIFIQVLAGFFLRQYRSSMEEQRYYEGILRIRESQFLNYQILRSIDGADLKDFAKSLGEMKERDIIRMQQGETTVILEAARIEANEFKGIPEMFLDFFKSIKPINGEKKG